MCISCGCGEYGQKNDPADIADMQITAAAHSAEISTQQVLDNIVAWARDQGLQVEGSK